MRKEGADGNTEAAQSCKGVAGDVVEPKKQGDTVVIKLPIPKPASDELVELESRAVIGFQRTKNVYFLFEVLIEFDRAGLQAPKWVSKELAHRLEKHFSQPDPELLSSQMGVSARGSGSTNPYREFVSSKKRLDAMRDMHKLIQFFDISLTAAATAITNKHELEILPKTLIKNFRKFYPMLEKVYRRYSSSGFGKDLDAIRNNILANYPRGARKLLMGKMRPKT